MSINGCGMYNNYVLSRYGGAITLRDKALVTISRSDLRNNSATVGGGVYMTGFSSLTIQHSNVSSNQAKTSGGGICVSESASAYMYRIAVSENIALEGAGIHVSLDGKVDLDASHVEGNVAALKGGGLYTDHIYCMVQCGECYDDGKTDTCRESMKQFARSNGYGQITLVPLEGEDRLNAPSGITELTTYQCPRRCVNVTNTLMRFNSATSGAGVYWKLGRGATKTDQTKNEPSIFQCNHLDPEDRAQKTSAFDKIADRLLGARLRYGQRTQLLKLLKEGYAAYLQGSVTFASFKSANMTSESPCFDRDEEYGSLIEGDLHRPCNDFVPSAALLEEALLDTQACSTWQHSFTNGEYDTSTDTYTLGYGYFPSFGARSGKILAETLGRNPYAEALDYYDRINVLDFTTKCELLLDNSSTVDDDGIALEGKNWKTDLNIKNFNSTARKGILWFNLTRLMGDVGSSYLLKFTDESTRTLCETCDKSPVKLNLTIGPCAPGEALDGGRVCQECPIDTYSTRGEGCLPCPSGAVCRRKVSKGKLCILCHLF
jgi:predicted outer membrane repeat protein